MCKSTLQKEVASPVNHAVETDKRITFLCPHHRDWVYFNSQDALDTLDQIQIKGEILIDHQKWAEALPFIGSAWETTEILLQLYSGENISLVNRLGCLTILLCSCLEKLGHKDCANKICHQTTSALTVQLLQMQENSEKHTYLMACIEQLKTPEKFRVHIIPQPQQTTSMFH